MLKYTNILENLISLYLPSLPPLLSHLPSLYMLKLEKYGKNNSNISNYSSVSKILTPSPAPPRPQSLPHSSQILPHFPSGKLQKLQNNSKNDIIHINLKNLDPPPCLPPATGPSLTLHRFSHTSQMESFKNCKIIQKMT